MSVARLAAQAGHEQLNKVMSSSHSEIYLYPRQSRFSPPPGMRAAVSLHSHSECSRETLEFIPRFARQIPVVAACFERSLAEYQSHNGRPLDFGEWYFRPPVSPAALIDAEQAHLQRRLDLPGLVSMTDHDTVEGPLALRANGRTDVPLSFEWSVPFEKSMFHLGVHGIAPASIDATLRAAAGYTAGPPAGATRRLEELLDWLAGCPETFVVLNHPYWDLAGVGQLRHDSVLLAFLRAHHRWIHALELNGYRDWAENRLVLPLGRGLGIPVIGGGDRHALEPNAIVNLTRARSMPEFAHELRVERWSCCVLFPEYTDPHVARILQSAADILRPLREHHRGQTTWAERVFITMNGREHSVDSMWEREPLWLRSVIAMTRAIGSKRMGPLFELTRADGHETMEADCRPETVFDDAGRLAPDSAAA
jgi:hypothetical protein